MPKKKLTAAFVESVKVKKRTEYYDEVTSGLGLRVSPSGNKTFFFRYRYNGRNRRYNIGKYSRVITLKTARDRVDELRVQVKKGGDPQGEEQSIKNTSPKSFGELVDQYRANHLPKLKESTREDYENRIDQILKNISPGRYLKDIDRGDIFNYLDSKATTAPVQAQRIQAILSGIFKFALNRGWVEFNPASNINIKGKAKTADYKNVELSDEQIIKLWDAFTEYKNPTGALFKLLLILGQRSGETRLMKWSHVDTNEKLWVIPKTDTKNGLEHYVPLSEMALIVLDGVKRISGDKIYVFESPVKTGHPLGSSTKAAERIRERSGVNDFNIHSLRTTAATKMAKLGTSQQVLSKVLNHKNSGEGSAITAIYNKYDYEEEKRRALNAWGNYLSKIIAGESGSNILKMSS